MYVQPKTLDFIVRLIALCFFFVAFVVPAVFGGEVKCATDSYGKMNCSVLSTPVESRASSENKTFTVKKPDFLRRQVVVDENNEPVATCKENFYGNLKCRSR